MNKRYLPVEGCDVCEHYDDACYECILYGEAEEVEEDEDDS